MSEKPDHAPIAKASFWIAVIGIFVFIVLVGLRIALKVYQKPEWIIAIVNEHFASIVGLPLAMVASLVIVSMFRYQSGPVELEIAGLKFKGATGPVILWIFVFLSMAIAIKLLW